MKNELDEKTICEKISAASNSDSVNFEEVDRSAVNAQIAQNLPPKRILFNPLIKKFLPLAACLCLTVGGMTAVLSFAMRGSSSADPHIVEPVTHEELREKFHGILLPESDDYSLSSGELSLNAQTNTPQFAEMIYDVASDKLTLIIRFDAVANLPIIDTFPELAQTISINDIRISYAITDKKAFAQFDNESYDYYVIYDSKSPENITAILAYFV